MTGGDGASGLLGGQLPLGSGGLLSEGRKSIASFVRNAPTIGQLLRSRRRRLNRVHAILPSNAVVGEEVTMTVQVWDEYERHVHDFGGELQVEASDPRASVPETVRFEPADSGVVAVPGLAFETPGIHYVRVTHPPTGTSAPSNPVEVSKEPPAERLYWGDIHLHSKGSDGVGTVQKGMRFGRDVMALDVVAYTDHDTMGFFIPPSLQRWRMHHHFFDRATAIADEFNEPGSFVTLPGYEWTQQPGRGGHLNVYFQESETAALFDSHMADCRTYEGLWARLRRWRDQTGREVVTVPHHTAEAMYPFDFSVAAYDGELAPLVEVYSQWGSSEYRAAEGNEAAIGGIAQGEVEAPGHHVQHALAMGYRVGMLAASDFHGPHPGHSRIHVPPHLPRLSEVLTDGIGWGLIWRIWNERSYPGGLTAFYAAELTREEVFESLRNRQVYGTTQPDRIIVRFAVNGTHLRDPDSVVPLDGPDEPRQVRVFAAGTAPLDRVEVVKNNAVWRTAVGAGDGFDAYTMSAEFVDEIPVSGMAWDDDRRTDDDVYYVRVRQADGGMAWAGPLWAAA